MLKTIDGITFNTALATEVAHFGDGRERSDPRHVFEMLYRQGPHWFLVRRRDRKEDLIPIIPDQACTWLRQKNFIGQVALHFGERVKRTPATVL
jgi:hypothetical protein